VNLDVIFSIPGAPRQHWPATVHKLLALALSGEADAIVAEQSANDPHRASNDRLGLGVTSERVEALAESPPAMAR
jgi:hypothetical protein